MKKFFFRTFLFIFIFFAIYAFLRGVIRVDKNMVGVIRDLDTNNIVEVFSGEVLNRNFVWKGLFPWKFAVYIIPADRQLDFTMRIMIPQLQGLSQDYYFIKIPVSLSMKINISKFYDYNKLRNECTPLDDMVKQLVTHAFAKEIGPYLSPVYQPERLRNTGKDMRTIVFEKIRKHFKDRGLVLQGMDLTGKIIFPEWNVYNEGLLNAVEMRRLDIQLEKQLKELKSHVKSDVIKTRAYYKSLKEISKIIQVNPAILKYIYIDKMAGNIKVIISSDKSGLPAFLEQEPGLKKGKKQEIDNLR